MASEERKDATRYLPNLWNSLCQVIIHSRLGEKPGAISKSPTKRSTMFNIEINTDEEITYNLKKFLGNQVITPNTPFSLEILLQTSDKKIMAMEIWTLSLEENNDSFSQNLCTTTERMSVLLKSAICVSRITPAWGLSFTQGYQSHIMLYKLYTGKPSFEALGKNVTQVRVGQTNIQSHYISLHLAYRTDLTIHNEPRNSAPDQMMVKSDHFKVDSSPKRHRRISERVTDSSDTGATSDESQDASRWPFMSPMDFHHSSPRSRTSSESSNRGLFSTLSSEKIYIPFANNKKVPSLEEIFLQEEVHDTNILVSTIEKLETLEFEREREREAKERKISETESEGKPVKEVKSTEKTQMISSDHSTKSFASNTTREDEYVVVDMKTPFADATTNDLELSTYYKEWKSAPPLKEFSMKEPKSTDTLRPEIQPFENLTSQIEHYENELGIYDELVKSFHVEDLSNSQELG